MGETRDVKIIEKEAERALALSKSANTEARRIAMQSVFFALQWAVKLDKLTPTKRMEVRT